MINVLQAAPFRGRSMILEPDPHDEKRFALRRGGESGSRFMLDLDSRLQRNREAIPPQPIKV